MQKTMKEIDFLSFPNLITERLTLRYLKESDAPAIFSLRSDDTVNKYLDRPKIKSIDEAKDFIININEGIRLKKWIYWGICLKDVSELIGTICLWNFSDDTRTAETGYELLPSFQGKGLMDEALKCIINLGFQKIRLKVIEAYTHKENIGSIHLLERNNFKLAPFRYDDKNPNNSIYTLASFIIRES